jgi:hypothetical protein
LGGATKTTVKLGAVRRTVARIRATSETTTGDGAVNCDEETSVGRARRGLWTRKYAREGPGARKTVFATISSAMAGGANVGGATSVTVWKRRTLR